MTLWFFQEEAKESTSTATTNTSPKKLIFNVPTTFNGFTGHENSITN